MSSSLAERVGPLLGSQEPRVCNLPAGAVSRDAGQDAIDLAASAGLHLDPWQQFVLREAMAETASGLWAARNVGLVVPRQNGKGSILEALELAHLFLVDDTRAILHSAHEFKTAKDAYRRISELIKGSDHLNRLVVSWKNSNEETSIELVDGSKLRFMARSSGSGRGFQFDLLIFDEAYEFSDVALSAVSPTQLARRNPQTWLVSSPPTAASNGEVLQRTRDAGRSGTAPRLAYFEWSAAPSPSLNLDDPAVWAQANPAMGIRWGPDSIADQKAMLADDDFARECLGIWPDANRLTVIDPAVWFECGDPPSQPVLPVLFALDVSPDRRRAAIGLAGRRVDGLAHVELVPAARGGVMLPGTDWVVDRVAELWAQWSPPPIIIDSAGPAASFIPALLERGVQVQTTSTGEMRSACGLFYDLVLGRRLRYVPSAPLTEAVDGAAKRKLGDGWAWDRQDPTVDITPLVAVTLALYGSSLLAAAPPPKQPSKAYGF